MTREEAINTLKEIKITLETYNSWSKTQSFSEYPQALEKAIFALSADRPSGEWIDDTNTQGYVYCSQCNKMFNAYSAKTKYNYCPSCGTRMKGGDSE